MERLYQDIEYEVSIDAALIYWLNDAVYERLRRKRTQNIRPESWFRINFAKNKIYKRREYAGRGIGADRQNSSRNCGRPGYDHEGRAIGAVAKPGEFDEGIITLEGVPDSRPAQAVRQRP